MMLRQAGYQAVIHIHPAAPAKPGWGQPCNGCGVCCLAEPCPVGVLVSRRWRGTCAALVWDETQQRYLCGALQQARRVPTIGAALGALMSRWMAASTGCDSDAELES